MLAGLHHRDRNGEGRRLRTSDLMHVTHPLWPSKMVEANPDLESDCPAASQIPDVSGTDGKAFP
jgi:hypothetical protein